jgi:amidase
MSRTVRGRRTPHPSLTRRRLIAGGAVAGAAGVGLAVLIAGLDGGDGPSEIPLAAVQTPTPASTTPPPARPTTPPPTVAPTATEPLVLEHASIAQLRRALDGRRISVTELVEESLARIDRLDGGDAGLGAVIERNPDALEIARVRDQELAGGALRGPLHGIPVLVKDIFATADSMATTAGSLAMVENRVVQDATVVWRLRQAGAVVLGKTNLTEWSNFQGWVQTSGWSARGGQTRNPYQLDRTTWGSSSGSAAGVAAGYAPLALGSETDGSIVLPAAACSIVGIKPTVGLTSRAGVIPISFSQDSPGPMARTVEDAAYLLSAIAGYDENDPAYGEIGWSAPAARFADFPVHAPGSLDYTTFLDAEGLRGARIGVARNVFPDAAAGAVVEEILGVFAEAGATLVDPADIPTAGELAPGNTEFVVLITEFPYGLERYLATYTPDGPIAGVADVAAFNEINAAIELAYHDQSLMYRAQEVGSIWDAYYQETVQGNLRLARDQGLDAVLDELELDALIAPTCGAPTIISLGGDDYRGSCAQVSAIAGYPIVNVPVGYVDGLPLGISFMGRAFSEPTLLKLAFAFEQAHPVRQAPRFRLGTLE